MLYDFDWQSLIAGLDLDRGDPKTPHKQFYANADGRFNEIITKWTTAGYDKGDSVEWINYYPETHFSLEVINHFEKWSNSQCARAWISRIRPGKMAPFHQDIDDNIEKYLSKGQLIRFSIFISEPSSGAVFILKDDVYHLQPAGTILQWDDYLDWHAGMNAGFKDKFMFNFIGIKNDQ
jgi:hypothetical protein